MPEGHITHRAARLQGRELVGHHVTVVSPQGRFSDSAARVDEGKVIRVYAYGKHLFYEFASGLSIHVHLGLFGKFRTSSAPFPEPSPNARLLIQTDTYEVHLTGPNTCELLETDEVDGILGPLGPDPLGEPTGGDGFARRLSTRKIPIGRALLEQKVASGIGNVLRSELLFLVGVNPFTPAQELDTETVERLWAQTVRQLQFGERTGRIATVIAEDQPASAADETPEQRGRYTYYRDGEPCRRCATPISVNKIDSRNIWWCSYCQQ